MLRNRLFFILAGCLLATSAAWADDVGFVDCHDHSENIQVLGKAAKTSEVVASLPCGERFTVLVNAPFFSRIQTRDGKIGYIHSYLISRDYSATSVQPSAARTLAQTQPATARVAPSQAVQSQPVAADSRAETNASPLTNKNVVDMLKVGLTPEVVLAKIKSSACNFDTSPAALKELKAANVPDAVILAMVQASPTRQDYQRENSDQPTVVQILDKYVQALGGKPAIEKPKNSVLRASFEYQGKSGTVEVYAKAPNKLAVLTQLQGVGEVREGFDGSVGWYEDSQTGVREKTGQELSVTKRGAEFNGVLKLRELYPKMTLKGKQSVGDREAYVVEADPGDGSLRRMYFDAGTGLLVRNDIEYDTPQGRATFNWYFEDYREVGGIKMPFTRRRSDVDGSITYKVTEALQDVPIDDAKFAKPSQPQPPALAKEKPRITVQVVGTQTSERQYTYTIPGTAGTSTTNCNTNGNGSVYGTTNGSTINGTVDTNSTTNCTTTSQPGTPPSTHVSSIAQEHVRAIMADGTHVTLWCQAGFRRCASLQPGYYSAEVKGNTVWMYAHDLSGKEHKIKYKAVGGDW